MGKLLPVPSIQTIKRDLGAVENIEEGKIRSDELKEFLEKNNYEKYVWLSEDATRCVSRVEYDNTSDKFVGFVLPFNDDGIPDTSKFHNVEATQLKCSFTENNISQYIYCVMAQPLSLNASSFCLSAFGTDNKFKTKDVHKRLETIIDDLKNKGIRVLGVSSDGDTRLLKYMKIISQIGDKNKNDDEKGEKLNLFEDVFHANLSPEIYCIQDPLHILTKLRNTICKDSTHLSIGHLVVSTTFLINLIKENPRGEHLLSIGDVRIKDRMNVKSAIKLFDERVMKFLTSKEESATLFYLKIMQYVYETFNNIDQSPRIVIYKIWWAALALLIWRNIEGARDFISSNAYTCVQINAHSLLGLYRKLRDENLLKLFIPSLYNSQTCENFFRLARSFTTTQSTVINFSIYDFLHRLKRIQIAQDLQSQFTKGNKLCFKLIDKSFTFFLLEFL